MQLEESERGGREGAPKLHFTAVQVGQAVKFGSTLILSTWYCLPTPPTLCFRLRSSD